MEPSSLGTQSLIDATTRENTPEMTSYIFQVDEYSSGTFDSRIISTRAPMISELVTMAIYNETDLASPHENYTNNGSFLADLGVNGQEIEDMSFLDEVLTFRWPRLALLIMMLLCVAGNLMVLITVGTNKRLHTHFYLLMTSLAAGDLFCSLTAMPASIYRSVLVYSQGNQLPSWLCHGWQWIFLGISCLRLSHMVTATLYCYVTLQSPVIRRPLMSAFSVIVSIFVAWLTPLLLTVPYIVLQTVTEDDTLGVYKCLSLNMYHFYAGIIPCFLVPCIAMVIVYIMLTIAINSQLMISQQLNGIDSDSEISSTGFVTYESSSDGQGESEDIETKDLGQAEAGKLGNNFVQNVLTTFPTMLADLIDGDFTEQNGHIKNGSVKIKHSNDIDLNRKCAAETVMTMLETLHCASSIQAKVEEVTNKNKGIIETDDAIKIDTQGQDNCLSDGIGDSDSLVIHNIDEKTQNMDVFPFKGSPLQEEKSTDKAKKCNSVTSDTKDEINDQPIFESHTQNERDVQQEKNRKTLDDENSKSHEIIKNDKNKNKISIVHVKGRCGKEALNVPLEGDDDSRLHLEITSILLSQETSPTQGIENPGFDLGEVGPEENTLLPFSESIKAKKGDIQKEVNENGSDKLEIDSKGKIEKVSHEVIRNGSLTSAEKKDGTDIETETAAEDVPKNGKTYKSILKKEGAPKTNSKTVTFNLPETTSERWKRKIKRQLSWSHRSKSNSGFFLKKNPVLDSGQEDPADVVENGTSNTQNSETIPETLSQFRQLENQTQSQKGHCKRLAARIKKNMLYSRVLCYMFLLLVTFNMPYMISSTLVVFRPMMTKTLLGSIYVLFEWMCYAPPLTFPFFYICIFKEFRKSLICFREKPRPN